MPDGAGTSYTPQVYKIGRDKGPRFQQPVLSTVLEYLRLGTFQLVTVGGSAALAKTLVAPLERIKIVSQTYPALNLPGPTKGGLSTDFSSRQLLRHIISKHGWQALFRGNAANVLRVVPEVMLKFSVNDQLKVIFASTTDSHQMSFSGKLAAGFATGLLRTTLFHPLSVVRTRLTADMGTMTGPRFYTGITDCVRRTWRGEGVRGFYGGFPMAALYSGPYLAVCFSSYDALQGLLPTDKRTQQMWWFPVAKIGIGAAAGVCAATLTYPLDTLRRRMEVNGALTHTKQVSTFACLRHMVQHEGVASLYRGCLVNCLKTAPSVALQFIAYDAFRTLMMAVDPAGVASSNL